MSPRAKGRYSGGCGVEDEVEARGCGEELEVEIAREGRGAAVDAALGGLSFAEARLAALGQHLRPDGGGALQIAGGDLDQGVP
jgi:hypothetical protein